MNREIDIDEISDGKRYHSNDMVKIACNECNGCSSCCHDMGKSIILDPYDIYQITLALNTSFAELISADAPAIELSMADNLLLPNIAMQKDRNCCSFLSESGRCTIHKHRPGFCRLFPLGRIYENSSFSYFHQIHECQYPNKSKIKIKKWLGIDNLPAYEDFVLKWHDLLDATRQYLADLPDINSVSAQTSKFLSTFYVEAYRPNESFYEQFASRVDSYISTRE